MPGRRECIEIASGRGAKSVEEKGEGRVRKRRSGKLKDGKIEKQYSQRKAEYVTVLVKSMLV